MPFKFPFNKLNETLRHSAEQLLHRVGDQESDLHLPKTEQDVRTMLHELQVQQMELEIQNEELRLTQVSLANARDQYRELYDYAPVAYITVDSNGNIHDANHKADAILNSSVKTLKGQNLSAFISAISQEEYYFHQRNIFGDTSCKDTSKHTTKLRLKADKNGIEKVVQLESIVLSTQHLCHMVIIDITTEQESQERMKQLNASLEKLVAKRTREIRESHDHLSALLNAAADVIITFDEYGTIKSSNPAIIQMFGYEQDELIGRCISDLIPSTNLLGMNGSARENSQTAEVSELVGMPREMLAKRKDSSTLDVSISTSQIDSQKLYTGIIRDTSERVELEKQVMARTEDERNRIGRELHDGIGQNLAGLALKTFSASRKLRNIDRNLSEFMQSISHDLNGTVKEIRQIIDNLVPIDLAEGDLHQAFLQLINTQKKITEATIELLWQNNMPKVEKSKAVQLYRIAQEALNNAIKYSQASIITVSLQQSHDTFRLTITDNGVGMGTLKTQSSPLSGHGLNNMRYRAHIIGAELLIQSQPSGGVSVVCTLIC